MTGFTTLDRPGFERLALWLQELPSSMTPADCPAAVSECGGVADDADPALFVVPALGDAEGDFLFVDERLFSVSIPTTTQVRGCPPEVLEAYAEQVQWARALFGDPIAQAAGGLPNCSFGVQSGRMVVATGGGVMLRWETAALLALDGLVLDDEDRSA